MEITRAFKKYIASLATAKGRKEHRLFVAEGTKCVIETLSFFDPEYLLAIDGWKETHGDKLPGDAEVITVKRSDVKEMSSLITPPEVIAVYSIPEMVIPEVSQGKLYLALDRVQDPGNLGTIVRIASWMGIENVVCSHDCVDLYNPKVVQSTMGAIARVRVCYVDLPQWLAEVQAARLPVYGTFLDGEDIYKTELSASGVIVMGNEGQGICAEVERLVDRKLLIPSYPPERECVESLNVSVATAITVAEFRRRQYR